MRKISDLFTDDHLKNIDLDHFQHNFISDTLYLNKNKYNEEQMLYAFMFEKNEIFGNDVIDLRSENKKIIMTLNTSFFHFISDNIGHLLMISIIEPDIEFIFDTGMISLLDQGENIDYIKYFLKKIKESNIKYQLVNVSQYNSVIINNFYCQPTTTKMCYAPIVYDFFKNNTIKKNVTPFRKVYISRKLIEHKRRDIKRFRINNHDKIEKMFLDLGFEIVYAENFKSFEDQINYFYETKILASLTGSGLTNCIFMQPGQTVIELFTPLLLQEGTPEGLHFFYHVTATSKEHKYISLNNLDKSSELIKEAFYNNKNFLGFVKNE